MFYQLLKRIFEKKEFTKIENDKINLQEANDTKTFFCFVKDNVDSAIEMSSVVSVHNINECEKPFVKIKKNIVLGNLNNQLIPIFPYQFRKKFSYFKNKRKNFWNCL